MTTKARLERNRRIGKVFDATPAGSLHHALGVPAGTRIPLAKLREALRFTGARRPLAAKAALVLRLRASRLRKQRDAA
jgi:hypothetical protein